MGAVLKARSVGARCGGGRILAQARSAVLLAVIQLATSADVRAQVPPASTCERCRIERVHLATLGSPSDTVLLGLSSSPVSLSDGRFAAISGTGSELMLFGPNGAFIKAAGRQGRGPGELYAANSLMIGPGDTLWVQRPGRLDAFTSELRYVRSINCSGPPGGSGPYVQLRSGHFVWSNLSQAVANFLFVMRSDGGETRAFGGSRLPPEPCTLCRLRLIAQVAGSSEFYAIPRDRYVLEGWTAAGRLTSEYQIAADWLPASPQTTRREPGSPPSAAISGLTTGDAGLIWVVGAAPNEKWKPPAPAGRTTVAGIRVTRQNDLPRVQIDDTGYTTIVDVLDSDSGQLLTRTRFDGELMYPIAGGYLFARRQDDVGFVLIDVWRLRLVR